MARRTTRQGSEVQNSKQFDDRLRCCKHGYLQRRVGVCVLEPYFHKGLRCEVAEVETEFPEVNTGMVGSVVPIEDLDKQVCSGLRKCINTCEMIRDEMDRHIERMRAEIERID